jgi:hypothetical protein
MYFDNVKTTDQAKTLFRELCMELHPDTSGRDSEMEFIRMYNEFKKFKTADGNEDVNFDASKFYNMLKNFDVLEDIKVNFIGSFIWFEDLKPNATYKQREVLKNISLDGFNKIRFAPIKKLWYFSPVDYIQKSKGIQDIEEIKKKYGAESFTLKGLKKVH